MDEDYQNPILPGSLGGISKFRKEQIRKGRNISTQQAKAALERVDSYSIYKKGKQNFLTRPVVTLTSREKTLLRIQIDAGPLWRDPCGGP